MTKGEVGSKLVSDLVNERVTEGLVGSKVVSCLNEKVAKGFHKKSNCIICVILKWSIDCVLCVSQCVWV